MNDIDTLPEELSWHWLPNSELTVVHGVSEWQTIPGQWPWQTAASALVRAGHTNCTAVNWSPKTFGWQHGAVHYSQYSQPELRSSWQSPKISSRQQGEL